MLATRGILDEIDILVVGGGTSGATLAGILARDANRRVLLLEAGPDYGALSAGGWPADLLDASTIPPSHGWGYSGIAHHSHTEPTSFDRACVIGGCSAHNGCVALIGHRRDYDGWAELGNSGWEWDRFAPAVERAKQGLRVRLVPDEQVTPYHQAFIDGAVAAGIPRVADMNDPDDDQGVAASPVNIFEGTRWNAALGYLDPVRHRPNLTVIGGALVDRVELRADRAVAVHAIVGGERLRIPARRIVLSAGAYGSPAILLRSGIGPADDLRPLGIQVVHALDGVGRGLADHPDVGVRPKGSAQLTRLMEEFGAANWLPDEQSLAKARSRRCAQAFDLHLFAVWVRADDGSRYPIIDVSSVAPRSAGTLKITSADPSEAPIIDHGYLNDDDGHDIEVIVDGIELAREIIHAPGVAELMGGELWPGPAPRTRDDLRDFVRRDVGIYYHPACSCKMGPGTDPLAVVDPNGKVHGLDGLFVCDASAFPVLMRANTNLPAAAFAEHLSGPIGALD